MTPEQTANRIQCEWTEAWEVYAPNAAWEMLERLTAKALREAVAAERERCATICDTEAQSTLASRTWRDATALCTRRIRTPPPGDER